MSDSRTVTLPARLGDAFEAWSLGLGLTVAEGLEAIVASVLDPAAPWPDTPGYLGPVLEWSERSGNRKVSGPRRTVPVRVDLTIATYATLAADAAQRGMSPRARAGLAVEDGLAAAADRQPCPSDADAARRRLRPWPEHRAVHRPGARRGHPSGPGQELDASGHRHAAPLGRSHESVPRSTEHKEHRP